jgi:hypothetical protein
MSNVFSRKLNTMLVLALVICFTSVVTATAQTITSNQTGTHDGYFYSFWTAGGGSVSMTLGSGGNYSVNWSNCENFVCGKGWNPGSIKNVSYSGSFNGGSNGYLALYGWTKNELIEYYVVENYGSWTPPGASSSGTVSSDGGTYNLHRTQRVNQPSIIGTATFYQYWSVRTAKQSSGTITFSNHVNAWKNKGWNLGSTWDYMIVCTEGYQSSGSSNITVGSGGTNPTPDPTSVPTNPPQETVAPTSPPAQTSLPGNGNGLWGEYFTGTDLSNLVLTKTDPVIDMDWVQGSPDASISSDNFSIRWTGRIEARSSETYTIIARSDDGMRVWINNQQIINDWTEHAATDVSGTISMQMGQQYDIRVEYFESGGEASVQLSWSTPTISRQVIPQSQLYSENVPQANLGDVNNDGQINVVDALLTAQYSVGLNPSNFDVNRADVDCNGTVSIVDALLIAQYAVGLVSSFC